MAQAKSMAQNKNHKNNSNSNKKIDSVGRSIEEGNCR